MKLECAFQKSILVHLLYHAYVLKGSCYVQNLLQR